jgi:hypothetical protein
MTTDTVQVTVHDLKELMGPRARLRDAHALLGVLHRLGVASRVGHQRGPTGHPRIVWQVPKTVTVKLGDA